MLKIENCKRGLCQNETEQNIITVLTKPLYLLYIYTNNIFHQSILNSNFYVYFQRHKKYTLQKLKLGFHCTRHST